MIRHLLLNTWLNCLLLQRMGASSLPAPSTFLRKVWWHVICPTDVWMSALRWTVSSPSRPTDKARWSVRCCIRWHLHCFGSSRDPIRCMALSLHPNGRPELRNAGHPHLLEIGPSGCQWSAAQCMTDGRIIAVGATIGGIEADFIVARYLPDGQLDREFGNGHGWLRTRLGRSLDIANSLAVQADGHILVGGYSLDGNYRAMVARYLNQ
jgi:hypothetical protein